MNFVGPYSDLPYGAFPVSRPGRHTDIRKVAPSTGFPLSLDQIKIALRVDSDDEDDIIMGMARSAAAFLEVRSGAAVLAGRYEAHFTDWCLLAPWEFMRWPLREVTSIAYLDGKSSPPTWMDVDLDHFFIDHRSRSFLIQPHRTFRAPQVWAPFNGIRVRFIAGFDVVLASGQSDGEQVSESDADEEPKPLDDGIRQALLLLIGHYYQNRELFVAGRISDIDAGASSILLGYRMFW